ncbi:MAG: hypothetical protein U9R38_03645 [Candidatus Margulisiibacteriota bacterium]|nr:hypothetical protein [Candidatus Margulisiibacteriota bacterium]
MNSYIRKIKTDLMQYLNKYLVGEMRVQVGLFSICGIQQSPQFIQWLDMGLIEFAKEFVEMNNLDNSKYILGMNNIFKTSRFNLLLRKMLIEYFQKILTYFYEVVNGDSLQPQSVYLVDNIINRYAVDKFKQYEKTRMLKVIWLKSQNIVERFLNVFIKGVYVLLISMISGLKLSRRKENYKVMREAIWGINSRGRYFCDDFIVDGKLIKKDELLLYSRGLPTEEGRLQAYSDAKAFGYNHIDINKLPISVRVLLKRIMPKYFVYLFFILMRNLLSPCFCLFSSINYNYVSYAIPYEKIFSNYKLNAELGHNYFSASHIAEAIVCQNYGTKYYLMHWSDHSLKINRYISAFLGCDKYLVWGDAHIRGVEGPPDIYQRVGYLFKEAINNVKIDKSSYLHKLGINDSSKVISFFDETFGGTCKMTAENYVSFWELILKCAKEQKDKLIIVKPKEIKRYLGLPKELIDRFVLIKQELEKMANVNILIDKEVSFIEVIGVSDIVVTQGMTSSSTIAIVSGINGLYFDQANYDHPFAGQFAGEIVFDNADEILNKITGMLEEGASTIVPDNILKEYDYYNDELSLDRYRSIITGEK